MCSRRALRHHPNKPTQLVGFVRSRNLSCRRILIWLEQFLPVVVKSGILKLKFGEEVIAAGVRLSAKALRFSNTRVIKSSSERRPHLSAATGTLVSL